jgi:hypothetical protein
MRPPLLPILTRRRAAERSLLAEFADGLSVGNLPSSANWQELSGMACPTPPANAGNAWIVSDQPANMLAAISLTDASSQGVWTLQGVSIAAPADWEEVATARVGGVSYLYVGDLGDNANARATFNIHRCVEPVITGGDGTILSGDIHTIVCAYPGGGGAPTHKDAECLIVDPDSGDLYIITKRESIPGVYYLPHQASYSGTQTLQYLGKMWDVPDITTVPLGATACNVVGGTISSDGKEILIKNYDAIYYFARPDKAVSIYTALTQTPAQVSYVGGGSVSPKKSHPQAEPQGEAVCFSYGDQDYFTASEYLATEGSTASRFPLFKYTRLPRAATTAAFQDGVAPDAGYAGTLDTYIWQTNPSTVRGTETTIVLDITTGTPSDDRRALLKFDLSSIPTNAIVVGARLDFWISAEGQGWAWYRMLVPWDENSTHNSLGGVSNDGVKAVAAESTRNGVNLDTVLNVSVRDNMLVSDVQQMVSSPSTNYGWLGLNTDPAGDGVQFDSRQSATPARRPKLTVRYYLP